MTDNKEKRHTNKHEHERKQDYQNKELAKAIIREFFSMIDTKFGTYMRKKLVYIFIALIVVGAISVGIIKIPGGH